MTRRKKKRTKKNVTAAAPATKKSPGILDACLQLLPGKDRLPSEQAYGSLLLGLALFIGLTVRLWLAFTDHGTYWPDEVFQSLEPAHKLVFGYGKIPWEFLYGMRNWAFPGTIAGVMGVCDLVGLDSPEIYMGVIRVILCLLSTLTGYGVYLLARAFGVDRLVSAAAATAFLFAATNIYFSHRALSENPSTTCIILGLALALREPSRKRDSYIGVSLLGLATLLRLQSGLFCVGLLIILLVRKQYRSALKATLILGIWAAIYGLVDLFTWGSPFFSFIQYVRFNLLQAGSESYGVEPLSYYFTSLFTSMEVVTVALTACMLPALRKNPVVPLLAVACIVSYSALAHKELRFIMTVWPLMAASAGIGIASLNQPKLRKIATVALVVVSLFSLANHRSLTFGDLASRDKVLHQDNAYDHGGPAIRLTMKAKGQKDICGVVLSSPYPTWAAGWFHLHKKVSLTRSRKWQKAYRRYYNYVITAQQPPENADIVATDNGTHLIRFHKDPCTPRVEENQRLDRVTRDLPLPPKSLFLDIHEELVKKTLIEKNSD